MSIERVSRRELLLPALQKGAKAAIFEAGPIADSEAVAPLAEWPSNMEYALGELLKIGHMPNNAQERFIREKQKELSNKFGQKTGNAFAAICKDLLASIQDVPQYTPRSPIVLSPRTSPAANGEWHPDMRFEETRKDLRKLRLLRTYHRSSAEYADDIFGKGRVKSADGSMSLHTIGEEGAIHRTPPDQGEHRLAVVVALEKEF